MRGKKRTPSKLPTFIRVCSIERFPDVEDAVEHTRMQAVDGGVEISGSPEITEIVVGGRPARRVEFRR